MKKLALFALISVFSTAAIADTTGTIAPSGAPTAQPITSAECDMVATTSNFDFVPSAYVGIAWACTPTAAAVQAGSQKGKFAYGGSTNGGGVMKCTSEVDTSTGYATAPSSAGGTGC